MVIKLNKRILMIILATVICIMGIFYNLFFRKSEVLSTFPIKDQIIVLDAGHGGLDGGASSKSGLVEKDITLKIAKYLESYLVQGGAKVVMTRTTDTSLHQTENTTIKNKKREDLLKRREIANSSGADMLISIHLNYFEQSKYKGAQVFYETNFAESHSLATAIQKSMIDNLDKENTRTEMKINSSKLQFQNLSVPSVLVECGFLSNPYEATLLSTEEYQQKVAFSIYLGILNYYNS